jgi:hypothetical protein
MAMRDSLFRALPPGLLILGAMAAGLAGIIGLELYEAALDEGPTPIAPISLQAEKPPDLGLATVHSDQAARYVTAILARPLFSPTRRPDETAANKAAKATDLGRLTGVLVSPAGKSAIFVGPTGGKPIVVGEGGRIGEYVVRSIEAGAVTITGSEGQRVLHPAFDPNPPPPKPKLAMPEPIVAPVIAVPEPPVNAGEKMRAERRLLSKQR